MVLLFIVLKSMFMCLGVIKAGASAAAGYTFSTRPPSRPILPTMGDVGHRELRYMGDLKAFKVT